MSTYIDYIMMPDSERGGLKGGRNDASLSMTPLAWLLIAVVVMLAVAAYCGVFRREGLVTSRVDREQYTVCEEYPNSQEAADILAEINAMYVRIITHLKRNRMNTRWAPEIEYLVKNYNPTVIGEHIPWNLSYTSYVSEKGKKIRFCLRTPGDRLRFHDMNTLRFVALHELAHLMTTSFGHEDDFWAAFRYLLIEAKALGEITVVDYRRHHQDYCGIVIKSNPALDR